MKLTQSSITPPRPAQSGFTLVEIAICLGIIIFALVAIIGVLPIGMNVQKDNREETIVGQDALYFMDAIRRGSQGLDDLTNYLVRASNYVYHFQADSNLIAADTRYYGFTSSNATVSSGGGPSSSWTFPLTNGGSIIGLLGTPRYVPLPGGDYYSNYVFADFRALNGPAADKYPQKDTNILDFAFAYRLTCEISPVPLTENTSRVALNFQTNLHELRLNFRWPLLPYSLGNNRQTFRTQVAGSVNMVILTNDALKVFQDLYFLDPNTVSFAPPR